MQVGKLTRFDIKKDMTQLPVNKEIHIRVVNGPFKNTGLASLRADVSYSFA